MAHETCADTLPVRSCPPDAMTLRLDMARIHDALLEVEYQWPVIDMELQRAKIGKKDPFTPFVRDNMLCAYTYLDELLAEHVEPFSEAGLGHMLVLNSCVHYGTDAKL